MPRHFVHTQTQYKVSENGSFGKISGDIQKLCSHSWLVTKETKTNFSLWQHCVLLSLIFGRQSVCRYLPCLHEATWCSAGANIVNKSFTYLHINVYSFTILRNRGIRAGYDHYLMQHFQNIVPATCIAGFAQELVVSTQCESCIDVSRVCTKVSTVLNSSLWLQHLYKWHVIIWASCCDLNLTV